MANLVIAEQLEDRLACALQRLVLSCQFGIWHSHTVLSARARKIMSIYISGSLAFDRIMTFPGHFHDHILAENLRTINVSFMVDGMETLQHLKEEGLTDGPVAMIALTANAIVGARETYINAGFADYLSKPIRPLTLENCAKASA